jgi:hypothetical protein
LERWINTNSVCVIFNPVHTATAASACCGCMLQEIIFLKLYFVYVDESDKFFGQRKTT